jgi:hypothetical protein
MAVQTYNPKEVRVTIAGQIVTGYADGTSVVIERGIPERYTAHVGAQGEVSRTATTNRTARLKITLKQTSPFNQTLQVIESTLNAAKFPTQISNKSDLKYLAGASESWIEVMPNKELGGEEQMREWVIFMADFTEKEG